MLFEQAISMTIYGARERLGEKTPATNVSRSETERILKPNGPSTRPFLNTFVFHS